MKNSCFSGFGCNPSTFSNNDGSAETDGMQCARNEVKMKENTTESDRYRSENVVLIN